MQETQEIWVWSLGQKDPMEKEMATHSSILAWRIPWRGLQSMGSPTVRHDWGQHNWYPMCTHLRHTGAWGLSEPKPVALVPWRPNSNLLNFTPPHSALMELGTVPGVQRSLCLTFWLASVPGGRLAVLDLLIVLWSGARAYRAVWLQPKASLPDRPLLSMTCHGAVGEGAALN